MVSLHPRFSQTNASAPVPPQPDPTTPVLQIEDLHVAYRAETSWVDVVSGVSLTIGRGETFGLVGESGCGKSTLAFSIMNYLGRNGRIRRGKVYFQGQDLSALTAIEQRQLWGRRIAMVYQNPQAALNPALPIGRQITEVLYYQAGMEERAARLQAQAMLEKVHMPNPAAVMQRYPHQLSGGMQQRVVIAMALITNPDLLIMDEPTTGLDVTTEAVVLDLVNELKHLFDAAILYISHDLRVVARVCNRVGVMYAGQLVESGAVADVFAQPRHPYTRDLLACIPRLDQHYRQGTLAAIPGRVPLPGERPAGCVYHPRCRYVREQCRQGVPELSGTLHRVRCFFADELLAHTTEATRETIRPGEPPAQPTQPIIPPPQPLLTVEQLHKTYDQGRKLEHLFRPQASPVRAVADVSFTIAAGTTFALVGESGCGKTTLGRCIVGLLTPGGGRIVFQGEDATRPTERRSVAQRQGMQMVFQHPDASLNPRHRVGALLGRALQRFSGKTRAEQRQRVTTLLQSVRLHADYAQRYPGQLSGGEKQRVALARAFASMPDLVVCDEAVSALDVSVQAAILNLLVDLQAERGCAYLFISHDLAVVRYIADQVGVMYLGKLVEIGSVEQVFSAPSHPYTEALLATITTPAPAGAGTPIRLQGTVPNPAQPLAGCPFHPRCPRRLETRCATEPPPWQEAGDGHRIACHISPAELRLLQKNR